MTYEEIAAVAEELQAAGIPPTQVKVKEKLGRGSYRDIATHLKTWRDKQEEAATATADAALPDELLAALASTAVKIRQQERERLDAAISAANTERDEVAAVLAKKEAELADANAAVSAARQAADVVSGQLAELKRHLKKQEDELVKNRKEIAELNRQLVQHQAALLNAEDMKTEIQALKRANAELIADVATAREKAVAAEATATAATARTNAAEDRVTKLLESLANARLEMSKCELDRQFTEDVQRSRKR